MLQVEMTASVRTVTGKGAMRQLRMKGLTPAVVYSGGSEGLALQLETQPLFQQLLKIYRRNAIVKLMLDDGTSKHVLVKDVQTDPIKDTLIHVDFYEIDVTMAQVFDVPVQYVGNAKGCDLGGILNVIADTIAVLGKPLDVPDDFVIDISALNIGESIQVGSVEIPEAITLLADEEAVCVSVISPRKGDSEEADEGLEEEAAAE